MKLVYIVCSISFFISQVICTYSPFKLAAKLSAIAYCPLDMIRKWSCHYCQETPPIEAVVSFNDSTVGVQGFVVVLNGSIIVSFRGTANYENRKNILRIFTTNAFPNIPLVKAPVAHIGFSSSYTAVKAIVQELILSYAIKYPLYEIYFVGHSLGGAISTLAALDAVVPKGYLSYLRKASQIHLYTMGTPRVGNKVFAQAIKELGINVYRSVNFSDPVPHLPLRSVGYYHFPREVFISEKGILTFCSDKEGEDSNCSNKLYAYPHQAAANLKYHGFYHGARMGKERCEI